MKTQVKIATLLISTSLLIVLFFGASIYYFLYDYSFEDFYKRLRTRATLAAQFAFEADSINAESFRILREKHLERLNEEREYIYEAGSAANIQRIDEKTDLPESFIRLILDKGEGRYKQEETFYTGIRYVNRGKIFVVIVSARNYFATHHLNYMRNIIVTGILLLAMLIFYLSVYFSRRLFTPIRSITDKVKEISSENMHLRIDERENDPEFNVLIHTFNDLLNRLETAFEIQKNFISNASHEFRTPLTAIMGEAEVMLNRERDPEDYRQSLRSILSQSERLNQITQTLLYLAETGYSNKVIEMDLIRSDELVWEAKSMVDKLNPGNQIQIDMSLLPDNPKKLKIMGNRSLLFIALTNLLTNACKYSNNKPVTISIASSNEHVLIIVRDMGIGIPESEMPFIYDPFFRASNTLRFEGYGIGLPLCRNIIKIHKGLLTILSTVHVGTTAEVKLPQAKLG
jgi:signal transduction histidine kinase